MKQNDEREGSSLVMTVRGVPEMEAASEKEIRVTSVVMINERVRWWESPNRGSLVRD